MRGNVSFQTASDISKGQKLLGPEACMIVNIGPLLSILFGVLILIFPKFLNYLVALYLILAGLVGLGVVAFR
jgi:hypothetical protein